MLGDIPLRYALLSVEDKIEYAVRFLKGWIKVLAELQRDGLQIFNKHSL